MALINSADNVYIGSIPVTRVYLGEHLIWERVVVPGDYGFGRGPFGTSPFGAFDPGFGVSPFSVSGFGE